MKHLILLSVSSIGWLTSKVAPSDAPLLEFWLLPISGHLLPLSWVYLYN